MPEGRSSRLGPVLYQIYARCRRKRIRRWVMEMVCRLEGGQIHSNTLRRIMAEVHGVEVGMYSDGGSFRIYAFDRGTKIGRYCSIADTATAWGANHPMSAKSMHAFFYNPFLGAVTKDPLTRTELTIGNDVWLGHNSIILNTVRTIGDGAVVGAGSVVHQDVPPYAVVAGNPARVVRYRFSKERIEELLEERWWEHSLEEIKSNGMAEFRIPVEGLEDRQQPAQDCNTPNGVVNVVNNAAPTAVGDELEQFIREVILGGQQMELDREAALIEEGVLDSLGLLQIVQFIEERFGVVVADGDVTLEQFGSISAMESYVQQLRAGE